MMIYCSPACLINMCSISRHKCLVVLVLCTLTLGLDKLVPKSIKCVFVGYLRIQNEYHCFDLTGRRTMSVMMSLVLHMLYIFL